MECIMHHNIVPPRYHHKFVLSEEYWFKFVSGLEWVLVGVSATACLVMIISWSKDAYLLIPKNYNTFDIEGFVYVCVFSVNSICSSFDLLCSIYNDLEIEHASSFHSHIDILWKPEASVRRQGYLKFSSNQFFSSVKITTNEYYLLMSVINKSIITL